MPTATAPTPFVENVVGFPAAAQAIADADVAAHVAAVDPHPQYASAADAAAAAPVPTVAGRTGDVTLATPDLTDATNSGRVLVASTSPFARGSALTAGTTVAPLDPNTVTVAQLLDALLANGFLPPPVPYLDPSARVFQDTAATVPATGAGQTVKAIQTADGLITLTDATASPVRTRQTVPGATGALVAALTAPAGAVTLMTGSGTRPGSTDHYAQADFLAFLKFDGTLPDTLSPNFSVFTNPGKGQFSTFSYALSNSAGGITVTGTGAWVLPADSTTSSISWNAGAANVAVGGIWFAVRQTYDAVGGSYLMRVYTGSGTLLATYTPAVAPTAGAHARFFGGSTTWGVNFARGDVIGSGNTMRYGRTYVRLGGLFSAGELAAVFAAGNYANPAPPPAPANVLAVASRPGGYQYLTTGLTGSADGGTAGAWNWAFGDALTGPGQTTTHTYTAPGTYTAAVTASNAGGSASGQCPVTVAVGPTVTRAGVVAAEAAATGKSATTDIALFTTGTTRSTTHWLAAYDWTNRGYNSNFTAVTRKHVLFATHFGVPSSVQFAAANGTLVTRTVVSSGQVSPGASGSAGDLSYGVLDSLLPTGAGGIVPAALPPASISTYFDPAAEAPVAAAILPWNPGRVGLSVALTTRQTWGLNFLVNPQAGRFLYLPSGGDSGSPVYLLFGGSQAVLLSHCFFNLLGPDYGSLVTALAALVAIDGQSLTLASMAGYTALY